MFRKIESLGDRRLPNLKRVKGETHSEGNFLSIMVYSFIILTPAGYLVSLWADNRISALKRETFGEKNYKNFE